MSYQDQADLATDPQFIRRLTSCATEEAKGRADNLAALVLRDPNAGVGCFLPFISTAPGFGDMFAAGGSESIGDGDILAAVQANWSAVSALYPAEPEGI